MEIQEIISGKELQLMVTLRPGEARQAGFTSEIAAEVVERSGPDKDADDHMAKELRDWADALERFLDAPQVGGEGRGGPATEYEPH